MVKKLNNNNHSSDILQNLELLDVRLVSLEKSNSEFKSKIDHLEKEARYDSRKDSAEVHEIRKEIVDIKKTIKNISLYIHHIINELKLTAKKEELNFLNKRIDNIAPFDFATENEARKIIKSIKD